MALTATQLQQWYCNQVSQMIDNIVGEYVYGPSRPYVLRASTDTETGVTDTQERAFIDNHGSLVYLARYQPIQSVTSGSYIPISGNGMTGGTPIPYDMTDVYWEGREIVHLGSFSQFGYAPLRVTVTYVDGFANALLTGAASSGTTTLAVDDRTGIVAGQELTIYDMPPEQVFVSSSWTPATGPGNLTLEVATANAHAAGVRISALGSDVQQAALHLVQHLIETRGPQAANPQMPTATNPTGGMNHYEMALDLLDQYILTVP